MKKRLISFLLVLVLLIGIAPLALGAPSHPFTDVPAVTDEVLDALSPVDRWTTVSIFRVYYLGIMRGTSPTTFSPNANFSREMVVATLFRMHHDRPANAADPRVTPFDDVNTEA